MDERIRERFSNQAEWIKQSEGYCERCANNRTRRDNMGLGCPIDDVRMECGYRPVFKEIAVKYLIGDCYEFKQCSMFLDRSSAGGV